VPGLALGLAFSFGVYGLLRKTVAADALTGLAVESVVLTPASVIFLIWLQTRGIAQFGHLDRVTDLLLIAGGGVTVFPLFCFAQAARRLRLTTVGFLQFLAPTLQFLLAIAVLNEDFDLNKLVGFAFIWLALALYTWDAFRQRRATVSKQRGPDRAMPGGSAEESTSPQAIEVY
jgi:chloramphenicol-sensitive protein RarD